MSREFYLVSERSPA